MSDRALVVLIAHAIFLSALALRLTRPARQHRVRSSAPWWIEWAPPLVWLPWTVTIFLEAGEVPLAREVEIAGLVLAAAGSLFAAWSMWTLGRTAYGVRLDVFEGHPLRTGGPYGVVRHPMYLGVIAYHVGASLALGDLLMLALTALVVVPYLALRVAYEERVLREAFGETYARYAERVPALLPLPR